MNNPGNFEDFSVLANRDQLERAGMWDEKVWAVHTSRGGHQNPNRVVQTFANNLHAAMAVYQSLRSNNMVALKNWLT